MMRSVPETVAGDAGRVSVLRPGDLVAVVAPASPLRTVDRGLLDDGVTLLESWGLRVRVQDGGTPYRYLSASDADRARHLHAALADSDVRAIFALRGGYGALRLLPHLAASAAAADKFLVGYSDITVVHAVAQRLWPGLRLIYGPNLATRQLLDRGPAAERNRRSLYDALFRQAAVRVEPVEFLCPGQAQGRLAGGCLSMVSALLGSSYALATDGTILLLEDRDEAPYRIDRLLTQLRNAGALDGVRGIVFGDMPGCVDPYNDLRDVVIDVLSDLRVPVAYGLPSGHGTVNLSLPLGAPAGLDSTASAFTVG